MNSLLNRTFVSYRTCHASTGGLATHWFTVFTTVNHSTCPSSRNPCIHNGTVCRQRDEGQWPGSYVDGFVGTLLGFLRAQYTPPTRRNCRVESRRRCVLGITAHWCLKLAGLKLFDDWRPSKYLYIIWWWWLCLHLNLQCESKNPRFPLKFSGIFSQTVGIFCPNFTPVIRSYLRSTANLLFNYLQLWRSHAILSVTAQYVQNVHHRPKRTLAFSDIFPKQLGIFGPNFKRLLHIPTYVSLQFFIQLSSTTTKLCHIKCDHRACVSANGGHMLTIWWWSRLIWRNFVKVAVH